jgi:hypothetical protein
LNKFQELQYTADDQVAKKRQLEEEEEEAAREAEAKRQEQRNGYQLGKVRTEWLSVQDHINWRPGSTQQGQQPGSEGKRGSRQQRSSFEERFDELCKSAMKASSSKGGAKCLPLQEADSRQNVPDPKSTEDRQKRLRFELCVEGTSPSSSSTVMPAIIASARRASCLPDNSSARSSTSPLEHSLPVPRMRNMNIAHLLNPRNRR